MRVGGGGIEFERSPERLFGGRPIPIPEGLDETEDHETFGESRTLTLSILFLGSFPSLAGEIELPFETEPSQAAILVRALVDGRPALLVLDTGASQTILANELVGLTAQDTGTPRFSSDGPGLNASGRYAEATLDLAGRLWRNRSVVGMSMAEVSKAFGRRIDGLLGQNLLREFDRVTIDYRAKRLFLAKDSPASGSSAR